MQAHSRKNEAVPIGRWGFLRTLASGIYCTLDTHRILRYAASWKAAKLYKEPKAPAHNSLALEVSEQSGIRCVSSSIVPKGVGRVPYQLKNDRKCTGNLYKT